VRLDGLEAYWAAGIWGILPDAAGQVSGEEARAVGRLLGGCRVRGERWPAVATPLLEVQARRLALLARALGEHAAALRVVVRLDIPRPVCQQALGLLEALEGGGT